MIKLININYKVYKLLKKYIKLSDILIFDKNMTSYIINKNNCTNFEDIIMPPCLLSKSEKIFDNIIEFNNNIECMHKLRDEQRHIVDKFFELYKTYDKCTPMYISIVCPCGFGKTILASDIICKLKYKCVIIVPRKFIIKQWEDKFNHNNNIFTSICGRKNAIVHINSNLNCDIFICPDKHLENDIIRNFIYQNFNVVIIDEIHKYNLNNNINITRFLYGSYFKVCIFLTATPSNNMNLMINEVIKINKNTDSIKKNLISFELKNIYNSKITDTKCLELIKRINKDNFTDKIYKNYNYKYCISLDKERNNDIIRIIDTITHDKTKSLILTDYRTHMYTLYEIIKNETELSDILYIYDVKNKDCNDLFDKLKLQDNFIIISTISACSESLDISNMNTYHIILPILNIKTITQCIGRILRNMNDDKYVYFYNFSYINDIIRTYINDNIILVKQIMKDWKYSVIKC
jgi:superfamily II DNA or RNA helicase